MAKRKAVPVGHLVAVRWLDAWGDTSKTLDDSDASHKLKPYEMLSYGVLLREDRRAIVLATDQIQDGNWRGISFIPRGMVVEIIDRGEAESITQSS